MSNITLLLNEKCFLFPNSINATDSQKELINNIFQKHEGGTILKIEPLDENDFFDSFLITTDKNLFCLKMSLSMDEIFYDFLILNGIQSLNISPTPVTRSQIFFGKEIFYTIQTYEQLNNLYSISNYELINDKNIFCKTLSLLNSIEIPIEIQQHLNTLGKLSEKNNKNTQLLFNSILNKNDIILKMQEIYNNVYIKYIELINNNLDIINLNRLNHGNLNHETILTDETEIKYINFENSFLGNDYFDIINLIFELQIVGIQEHSFLNKNLPEKMKENSEKLIFNVLL